MAPDDRMPAVRRSSRDILAPTVRGQCRPRPASPNAGVVLEDNFNLPAGDRVAPLLHVEPHARYRLLAVLVEWAGHRLNRPDLDRLLSRSRTCGDRSGGRQRHD